MNKHLSKDDLKWLMNKWKEDKHHYYGNANQKHNQTVLHICQNDYNQKDR